MGNMEVGIAILFISFFGLMILRVPITFCLITSAVVTGLYLGIPVMAIFMRVGDGVESFTFLAIPFFILAGEIMAAGGISDRLVKVADVLVGRFRGGLAYANIIDSTFFWRNIRFAYGGRIISWFYYDSYDGKAGISKGLYGSNYSCYCYSGTDYSAQP